MSDITTPTLDIIKHGLSHAQTVNSDQVLYNRIKEHNKYYDTFQNETPPEIGCECNDLYNCETADVMSVIQKRKSIYDDKQPLAYDIFLMKNILGYNHKAIVQKLNISSETVSYKYKLARLDLRRSLPQALLA